MSGQLLLIRGWWAPRRVGWSPRIRHSQTVLMAKNRKPTKRGKRASTPSTKGDLRQFGREVRPVTAGSRRDLGRQEDGSRQSVIDPALREDLQSPLAGVDPVEELIEALRLVCIDPHHEHKRPYVELLRAMTARTTHSELVALAVTHADDAKRLLPQTMFPGDSKAGWASALDQWFHPLEIAKRKDQLRELVRSTMQLRRSLPPVGDDQRRPLVMDGEIIDLVPPEADARSVLLTVKIPRVVIDRLRDAVMALAPDRTMGGIVALGVQMVLDQLEADYIRAMGHRFPKRAGQVLEGGRPSRTRATTAQAAPKAKKGQKPTSK